MENHSKSSKIRIAFKSTLIGFLVIASLALFGQERKVVLPNALPELPKDSSEVFNHINPDGISVPIRVYFPKGGEPYSVADQGEQYQNPNRRYWQFEYIYKTQEGRYVSYDEYNSYKGTAGFIKWKRINGGLDTILIKPPKGGTYEKAYAKFTGMKGKMIPKGSFYDMTGSVLSFQNFRGNVIVVNFWFTNCGACVKEIPDLNRLAEFFSDQKVTFLALALDSKEKLETFFERTKFSYQQIHSAEQIAEQFNILTFPAHFIVDQQGVITFVSDDSSKEIVSHLNDEIQRLLIE